MEPDEDISRPLTRGRAGRALTLMAISVLALGIATISYAHPQLSTGSGSHATPTPAPAATYRLSIVDFVDPNTGWLVAELPSHDFAVLRTSNSGRTWTRQLSGPGGDIGEYARFFDRSNGVVVLLGPQAVMFQTNDGGATWGRSDVQVGGGHVLAAEFVDAWDGWLLVQTSPGPRAAVVAESLYRTSDGGATWVDLGNPVSGQDWAYGVVFGGDHMSGWLYSRSTSGYVYATDDGGSTWRRVTLPAPHGAWPVAVPGASSPEEFFVGARPTAGAGVVAVVVPIPPPQGRSANGGVLIGYPPLTVRTFDGGGQIFYRYRTLADGSGYIAAADADQVELSSPDGGRSWRAISLPSIGGAVGFVDALDWWWVGAGGWATTSDGGVTWSRIRTTAVPDPVPGSLQVLDGDHAWFAGVTETRPYLEKTEDGGHDWATVGLPPISS